MSSLSCPNCSAPHAEFDLFCENCGCDFITGSVPDAAPQHSQIPAEAVTESTVYGPRAMTVEIEVDVDYFSAAVEEGTIELPSPVPTPAPVRVESVEVHVGRESESRGIHPDIDVASLTLDPAVSSRHCVLRVGAQGSMTVTDLGSTNGTLVGDIDSEPIEANISQPLEPDQWIYLGAWTRIRAKSA